MNINNRICTQNTAAVNVATAATKCQFKRLFTIQLNECAMSSAVTKVHEVNVTRYVTTCRKTITITDKHKFVHKALYVTVHGGFKSLKMIINNHTTLFMP